MEVPRQEYWSGLPLPSPGGLPNSGTELKSSALAGGFFTAEPAGKPCLLSQECLIYLLRAEHSTHRMVQWALHIGVLLLCLFYRQRSWGPASFSHMMKVEQLVRGRTRIKTSESISRGCTLSHKSVLSPSGHPVIRIRSAVLICSLENEIAIAIKFSKFFSNS